MNPDPDAAGVRATALHVTASWFGAVSSSLDAAFGDVAALAGRIAAAWPDARGAEWAERAALVHRELGREADASAELGRSLARAADDDLPAVVAPVAAARAVSSRPGGARLGGTEAARIDDERGVRIPQLPEPDRTG